MIFNEEMVGGRERVTTDSTDHNEQQDNIFIFVLSIVAFQFSNVI